MDLLLVTPEAIKFSDLQASSKSPVDRCLHAPPPHMLCISSAVDRCDCIGEIIMELIVSLYLFWLIALSHVRKSSGIGSEPSL